MKLTFTADQQYDLGITRWMLDNLPQNETSLLRKQLYLRTKKLRNEKALKEAVEKKYKVLPYIKKTIKMYQSSWDEINDNFFTVAAQKTGSAWKHKRFVCILSPVHRGVSNWGGNTIIRGWQENPFSMRKITAHELLISHLFSILNEHWQNLTDKQKWAIAEIAAFAITGLEKEMLRFWPWISQEEQYPLNHNYPELYDLQKALKKIYQEQPFAIFFQKAITLVKKNPL